MKKILAMLLTMLCFSGLLAGCKPDDGYRYSFPEVDDILGEMESEVMTDMLNTGIKFFDKNGDMIPHTVEEYKSFYHLSEDTLIAYYRMMHENKEESEKLVMALGYESWDDFLTRKGYLNDEGKPDVRVWREETYVELQKVYDKRMGRTQDDE